MKPSFTLLFILILLCTFSCKISNQANSVIVPVVVEKIPDPLMNQLWFLKNTGQAAFSASGGTVGADINLGNLYELGMTGKGIVVAVSDTNMNLTHEDLVGNFSQALSRNYLLPSSSQWPNNKPTLSTGTSTDAHGTSVSGIIAAVAENGKGGRGVAPEVTLAGFNFISSNQSLARKIDQAKGAYDVFNYSYGTITCTVVDADSAYIDQLKIGVTTQRGGKGSIYIKAAGNDYISSATPCNSHATYSYLGNANMDQANTTPYTMEVAALNSDGVLTSYSTPGSNLWLSAPGGEDGVSTPGMISTDLPGCTLGYSATNATNSNNFDKGLNPLNSNCNYSSTLEGTSFSAPVLTGAVAVILQARPSLSWRDVKYILAKTANQIDPTSINLGHPLGHDLAGWVYDHGWTENSAHFFFHNWYGFGALNLKAAVTMAQSYNLNQLGTLVETADPSTGEWHFQSGAVAATIADDSSTATTSTINVPSSLVIEGVQISVNITHSYPSELGIEIVSPSGTVSSILNVNSGIIINGLIDTKFLANAFYGENSAGNWTIRVVDGNATDTGTLNSWKINFFGHAP